MIMVKPRHRDPSTPQWFRREQQVLGVSSSLVAKLAAPEVLMTMLTMMMTMLTMMIRAGPQRPKCQKCYGTNFFHCVYTYK